MSNIHTDVHSAHNIWINTGVTAKYYVLMNQVMPADKCLPNW